MDGKLISSCTKCGKGYSRRLNNILYFQIKFILIMDGRVKRISARQRDLTDSSTSLPHTSQASGKPNSMKVQGGAFCAAVNCSRNCQENPGEHFFRFPKDDERCRKWILNTRRADLLGKRTDYSYKNLCLCVPMTRRTCSLVGGLGISIFDIMALGLA
jgi:hypothetical protein